MPRWIFLLLAALAFVGADVCLWQFVHLDWTTLSPQTVFLAIHYIGGMSVGAGSGAAAVSAFFTGRR